MYLHRFSNGILAVYLLLHLLCTSADDSAVPHHTVDTAINCGSAGISTAISGRKWTGDIKSRSTSLVQIMGSSTASSSTDNLVSTDPVPYKTARASRSQFSFTFQVNPGQKLIRLHFSRPCYRPFKKFKDFFTVKAGPFTLLGNFSASLTAEALGVKSFVKEYHINIEENQSLNIRFSPQHSQSHDTYAFINGIEIISMAANLYHSRAGNHGVQVVGQNYPLYVDKNTALEIIQRLYFRQDPISSIENSPMSSMWETVPDYKVKTIKNFTWKTSVDVGFGYLVRLHFCEAGDSVFGVLINNMVAETNVDIVKERSRKGIVWYRDYMLVVKGDKEEGRRDLTIVLQLKEQLLISDVLKGLEIFKLTNHDNSLASPNLSHPAQESLVMTLVNLLSAFGLVNSIATGAVIIISLANIITFELRNIWEVKSIEDGNKTPSLTERLCRPFSVSEIQLATENFSDALVIGKGGFGNVYKGFIDKGKQIVAVKRLKLSSRQGAHEFWTDVETLSKLRHSNLVSLIGYCRKFHEMILIYEYIPNGTLANHLFKIGGENEFESSLSWKQRLKICIGVGRGLDYLHTGTDHEIIHRDIKASNILLDENLEAKISDFGLAKPLKRSLVQSHVSTNVKGTFGYFDPAYFRTRKLSRKSDIYAFGVVLLEVLSGRRALDLRVTTEDKINLTVWAQDCISKGEVDQLVAPCLTGQISPDNLMTFLEVAERCLYDEPKRRPSMAQVVVELEFVLEQLDNSKSVQEINRSHYVTSKTGETTQPIFEETQEMPSANEQNISNPLGGINKSETVQIAEHSQRDTVADKRKTNAYKLSRFWPWDLLWNRAKPVKKKESDYSEIPDEGTLQYNLNTIRLATNNFSPDNKIGEGGFGSVYKGIFSSGQEIAIKRLSISSTQGAMEFKNEVVLVAKLQHRNLVKSLGVCFEGREKIIIYEFLPNKSLDYFLFDPEKRRLLDWSKRYTIIGGIARGMVYLHEDSRLRVIRRDLKASNILLDANLNPKISDFGMARLLGVDQSEGNTSRIVGTFGYMSPEYAMHGQFSVKSDVFSFGVLILEIVSGKKNSSFYWSDSAEDLISYAWKLWRENRPLELMDATLENLYARNEVIRCIQIGLLCVQEDVDERPTMASIVLTLNSSSATLAVPRQPAFFLYSSRTTDALTGQERDKSALTSRLLSTNEVSITELHPR